MYIYIHCNIYYPLYTHLSVTTMAKFSLTLFISFMPILVISQPLLNSAEQESVYRVLESINSDYPWRTLFPDDLCSSAPHGVVCDYSDDYSPPHVAELSFGYVSDYSPNPPCSSNSTLDTTLLLPLTHLRKLFFYKCFTETKIYFPDFSSLELEELVFVENSGLVGSIEGKIGNMTSLRRLVLTGSGVYGNVSFDELVNLEQVTLSRNRFKGEIFNFGGMKSLKILDLSQNEFQGNVDASVGDLSELLKIDLSYNGFSGKVPDLKGLKKLEFLDLSYNKFGNFGIPLFLGEMGSLKEVYMSGNLLGGQIPEIWENLGGVKAIGLSGVGLVGKIPNSMGVNLRNLCYLGLDNNRLEGTVPEEFEGLEFVSELNLENNSLSGRIPFSPGFVSKLGGKLKLEGNVDLCVERSVFANTSGNTGDMKACRRMLIPETALFDESSCSGLIQRASLAIGVCWVLFLVLEVLR